MSTLERTTHVCLIGLALISAMLLLEKRFEPAHSAGGPPRASPTALLGRHLDVPGLDWKLSRMNAVLFINSHCHFCQDSMPFYRKLADSQHGSPAGMILTVLSVEPPEVVRKLILTEHVAAAGVYRVPPIQELVGTPILLFVDQTGTVRRLFIGKLDPSHEQEVFKVVHRGAI